MGLAVKSHKCKSMKRKEPAYDAPAGARVASSKKLQKMKRDSQKRDHRLVARGGAVDEMFLIRPHIARRAKVTWAKDD